MHATYVKHPRRNRRKTVTIAGLICLALTGTAIAAWFVMSRGNGAAGIGTLNAPTVAMGPAEHDLYPGGTGVSSYSITNTNAGTLYITDARASTVNADIHSDVPLCEGGNILAIVPQPNLHIAVPNGTTLVKIPGMYQLANNAPSECQGANMYIESQLTFSTP